MPGIPDSVRHKFDRIIKESPNAQKRFKLWLNGDSRDENFKWAMEFSHERAYGKPRESIELTQNESDRPTTEVLLQTLTATRAELDNLRKRTGLAKAE